MNAVVSNRTGPGLSSASTGVAVPTPADVFAVVFGPPAQPEPAIGGCIWPSWIIMLIES